MSSAGEVYENLRRPLSYSDKQCPFLGLGSKLSHFLKLNPEISCSVSVLPNMSPFKVLGISVNIEKTNTTESVL